MYKDSKFCGLEIGNEAQREEWLGQCYSTYSPRQQHKQNPSIVLHFLP